MFLVDLVFALIIAFVLAVLLSSVFGWRHPARRDDEAAWPAAFFLFLILFFFVWAGGLWTGPYGPVLWSGAWLPFLLVGVVVSLVILAVAEPRPRRRDLPARSSHGDNPERVATGVMIFGGAFWVLLLVLLGVIVVGYLT